jgi:hypothetical protein
MLIPGRWYSAEDAVKALGSHDRRLISETRFGLQMAALGDLSPALVRLREELPAWESFPKECCLALLEAENRLQRVGAASDSTPTLTAIQVHYRRGLQRLTLPRQLSAPRPFR